MLHATHFICFASTTALQSSVFTAFADNRLGVLFGGLHFNSVSDVSYAALVSFSSARRSAKWTAFAVWMPKKEHHGNFTLWGEKGLTATLPYWMVAHQTKVHCHLMKREKPFHTSKLAVFKRNSK